MGRITWFFLVQYSCFIAASCMTMAADIETNLRTDQSALLALRASISSDPHKMLSTNWSTTSSICNWAGVTCATRHYRVAVLNLSYFDLTGTIPPELGNLSFLSELRLRNNSFHGTLPQEFARLRRLRFISLGYNKFMGTIPSWFGSLSKLQIFSLYGNQFTGSIPAAIFNLPALEIIDLEDNQLSGKIPREIGNLTTLKEIYLDSNNFKEIPKEIGILDQLEMLFVQWNALKGPIPMAVFNMSSLTMLALYGNSLRGSLPDSICQHLKSIQVLNLGSNQLDGPLPSRLWECKKLLQFKVPGNSFSGEIPNTFGNLTRIQILELSLNYLTGPIPHEIGHLQNLEELVLGGNTLNEAIPSSIFNMSKIEVIAFFENHLSGSLPPNTGLGLTNLQRLYLGGNKLSGVIPKSLSNASNIMDMDLGSNLLLGVIPSTLCSLTKLQRLQLFSNNLTIGTSTPELNVLSCLENLTNLWRLDFSENPLNANLPVSFRKTSLQYIYFYNCNMRGIIPSDIGNLSSLIVISLVKNQLSGLVPASIGRIETLQGLYLESNTFQGHMPDELCYLKNLVSLVLADNRFTGSIPSCFGNLSTALRTLSLESNLLTSTIPSTLWGLAYVLYLNLSSNFLIGSIGEGIDSLEVATNIDFSHNLLSGSIASSIGRLQNLVNLSLASNKLYGSIPTSLENCLSLKSLDLSNNNLSGVIPKSLEALSYLKYLNVSFNRLQGEIPTGGPFRNLSAQSFVSNYRLCGASRFQVPTCKRKTGKTIFKYVIPGILSAMLLVTSIWILILWRKKNAKAAPETTFLPQLQWRRVSYQELLRATNGFNMSNLLGTGSFGSVYKGTLSEGIDVAIKVFNLETEGAFSSFDVECEMLSNIRHRNLIKVISCCSQVDFKAVVLTYMPNGSLEKWLYSRNLSLNILQRLNILIDVASALEYLHHGYGTTIVHCDLKPSNILLDDDMVAYVTDFGIAKLLGGEDSVTRTITLATIGYMAPEYGRYGVVTRRGDIYSFGIVVMETFTKRRPTDEMFVEEMNLKHWVTNSLLADEIVEVVDTTLLGTQEYDDFVSKRDCLSSIMRLAIACCGESPEERINMHEALATLNSIKIKYLKNASEGVPLSRHGL